MITLEYDGTEKALGDWGFALESCQARHVNLAASSFIGFVPGASVSDDPLFTFESKVVIRANRTGSGTSWSGGYVAFIGYTMSPQASQDGSGAGVAYEFQNAWYLMENMVFEQRYASYDNAAHALEYKFISDIQLFTTLDGSDLLVPQDAGEQINEIIDYTNDRAIEAGFAQPMIIGTIDPAIEFPSYQVREMMCADAVLKCLEMSPDVSCWFDYTTDIATVPTPTVHFYSRASRTSKSLAILNGTDHKSLAIVPRNDLLVRSVVIQYKVTGTADGNTWIYVGDSYRDKHGPLGANNAGDPDKGLRVIRQTIDLQGAQTSNVSARIECATVNATHATEATRLDWWKDKIQWLRSNKLDGLAIDPASVTIQEKVSGSWVAVSLATYPRELTTGQIADWMGFNLKWVTITAKASYTKYVNSTAASAATAALAVEKAEEKEISCRILVTDGTTGTYSALESFVAGEDMPSGIAAAVYGSLGTLQYQGNDVRVQPEVMNATGDGPLIHLGHKLNLTGGRSAWTTMNAQVQTITEHHGRGETQISFGPAKHIAAGDLAAMFQWNRWRRYWYNPNLRETASIGGGSGVSLGEDVPKENSIAGSGTSKLIAAKYDFTGV